MSIWVDRNDAKLIDRYKSQTILIDTDPIGTIDFDLTNDEKDYLVRQGQLAALRYLAEHRLLDAAQLLALPQMQTMVDTLRATISRAREVNRSRIRRRRPATALVLGCVATAVGVAFRPMTVHEATKACQLTARIEPLAGDLRPLFLTVYAGGKKTRFPIQPSKPIDFAILPMDVSGYNLILEWSDSTESNFGAFSGCKPVSNRKSDDERSSIQFAPNN